MPNFTLTEGKFICEPFNAEVLISVNQLGRPVFTINCTGTQTALSYTNLFEVHWQFDRYETAIGHIQALYNANQLDLTSDENDRVFYEYKGTRYMINCFHDVASLGHALESEH